MSWFSSAAKKVGSGIKKVANTKVAGVSLGGMLGPGGQLLRGGDIKQNFIDDAKAGARNTPLVLAGVAAAPKGGVSGGETIPMEPDDPTARNPGGGQTTGTNPEKSWVDTLKEHAGDAVSAIAQFAKDHGTDVLTAWNVVNAAKRQGQADDYAKGALSDTQASYDSRAGLRSAGISGMMDPSQGTPDLSNIRRLSTSGSGNPFARALPMAGQATSFQAQKQTIPMQGTPGKTDSVFKLGNSTDPLPPIGTVQSGQGFNLPNGPVAPPPGTPGVRTLPPLPPQKRPAIPMAPADVEDPTRIY